jgi:HD superfamily phosphohydrolase
VRDSRHIRDPIHGFIELTPREVDIVDSQVFQRLRRIKQLAFTYLVYPGALHTRFEHSLGVCHIASKMADKLGCDESEKEIVRLASLVHDLGHGPFSHLSEYVLSMYAPEEEEGETEEIHERITRRIIQEDEIISDVFGKDSQSIRCR